MAKKEIIIHEGMGTMPWAKRDQLSLRRFKLPVATCDLIEVLSEASQIPASEVVDIAMRRFRKEITSRLGVDPRSLSDDELATKILPVMMQLSKEDKILWKEQFPYA